MAKITLRYNKNLEFPSLRNLAQVEILMDGLRTHVAELLYVKGIGGPSAKEIDWEVAPFDPESTLSSSELPNIVLEIETSGYGDRKRKLESPRSDEKRLDLLRDFHHGLEDRILLFDSNTFETKLIYTDPNNRSIIG